jgi:hypothetical protein
LENLKRKDHLEDKGTNGKKTLEGILGKKGREGVDWMHLAQDGGHWEALVKMVMNLQVP